MIGKNMNSIPVMIVTLCRYEHFVRCIQSLKNNMLAQETELYIGLDYPLKQGHWSGYQKIETYLENGIDGFKTVHVIKHKKNLGPTKNYEAVRNEIYKRHDSYIYIEDDNEVSPNFLEYMNQCMNYYKNDTNVLAVSGYMYPIDSSGSKGNIISLNTYFSCFGYGVYRRTDELFKKDINMRNFLCMYHNRKMMNKLRRTSANQYGNFVKGMLEYTGNELIYDGEIRERDLSYGLYMFFYGYKMIFPTVSKMRNRGFDGSGTNCSSQCSDKVVYREYDFAQQKIDLEEHFKMTYDDNDMTSIDWNRRLAHFFCVPKREMLVTMLAYYLSLLIGRKNVAKLIKIIRK